MIWPLIIGVLQVITGLAFIFAGGVAYGREEKWRWVILFTLAGVIMLLGQLTKFLAFLGGMLNT